MIPRARTQGIRLGGKRLYPVHHPISLWIKFYLFVCLLIYLKSSWVAWAGLKFTAILLPQPPKC